MVEHWWKSQNVNVKVIRTAKLQRIIFNSLRQRQTYVIYGAYHETSLFFRSCVVRPKNEQNTFVTSTYMERNCFMGT